MCTSLYIYTGWAQKHCYEMNTIDGRIVIKNFCKKIAQFYYARVGIKPISSGIMGITDCHLLLQVYITSCMKMGACLLNIDRN